MTVNYIEKNVFWYLVFWMKISYCNFLLCISNTFLSITLCGMLKNLFKVTCTSRNRGPLHESTSRHLSQKQDAGFVDHNVCVFTDECGQVKWYRHAENVLSTRPIMLGCKCFGNSILLEFLRNTGYSIEITIYCFSLNLPKWMTKVKRC